VRERYSSSLVSIFSLHSFLPFSTSPSLLSLPSLLLPPSFSLHPLSLPPVSSPSSTLSLPPFLPILSSLLLFSPSIHFDDGQRWDMLWVRGSVRLSLPVLPYYDTLNFPFLFSTFHFFFFLFYLFIFCMFSVLLVIDPTLSLFHVIL
jgi:hypothetical protein